MPVPTNKPRVFLSHSKRDEDFVKRLAEDLRHCQIEPWLDSLEIRHGQPWLEAIFRGGIATCDSVLVYVTENSIESEMVKKEMDAGLLQKLKDQRIGFLPYVEKEELRERLRPDVQCLQTPVWNDANYAELLPAVVSEVWRSYMERIVASATSEERARRLESQLELERLKSRQGSVFAESEDKDFRFIYNALNRLERVVFATFRKDGQKRTRLKEFPFEANVLALLMELLRRWAPEFHIELVAEILLKTARDKLPDEKGLPEGASLHCARHVDPTDELLTLGLLQHTAVAESQYSGPHWTLTFTDKVERFRYWLRYNDLMPEGLHLRAV